MRVHVTTELDAMRAIVVAMQELDGDKEAQGRVLRWLNARYEQGLSQKSLDLLSQMRMEHWQRSEPGIKLPADWMLCRCGGQTVRRDGTVVTDVDGGRHSATGCYGEHESPGRLRRKQEPCRCGRITIFSGLARLADDGSRHTSTGCTPPPEQEVACPHESWEADSRGNARKCADCGAMLPDDWKPPVDTSVDGHEEDQSRE